MRVHQLSARLDFGDAITNQVFEIDKRLKKWGFESDAYAEGLDDYAASLGRTDDKYKQFLSNSEDLLIYHYSIYCDNYKLFKKSRNKKILIYHNITPAHFFSGHNENLERVCKLGRRILPQFKDCDLALGVSEFNRLELVECGFPQEKTGVLPNFLTFDEFRNIPLNGKLLRQYEDAWFNFLSVGRLVPNKRPEDTIKTFFYYNRCVNVKSRLFMVGAPWLAEYNEQLSALVRKLGLVSKVVFTGKVTTSDLVTYYNLADVFLSSSEHEGFCVPLLEAMYFGVPIVASKHAAVPDTLGEAGILFTEKNHAAVAETIDLLRNDEKLRSRIVEKQSRRLGDFSEPEVEKKLKEHLKRVLGKV